MPHTVETLNKYHGEIESGKANKEAGNGDGVAILSRANSMQDRRKRTFEQNPARSEEISQFAIKRQAGTPDSEKTRFKSHDDTGET